MTEEASVLHEYKNELVGNNVSSEWSNKLLLNNKLMVKNNAKFKEDT